jgi:serine/threonine protein kinase
MINQQIQNYKIISLLGEGGMGDVYLGEHVSIKRKVAIKVLKPELVKNEEIRKRFKNEASMLAHLQHPNIVGLIDYVEQDGGLFLIMEYVDGQGLDELIKAQHSPISIERAKKLMTQILQAFLYAHKSGIVHRDVKPSNILITADDQIKVLDFGIAKLVGDSQHHLTKTGTQIGTVYYMSPEQVKGKELDYRSDIYSLGVTFYELLSGVCPYRSMSTEYEIYDTIVNVPLLPLTQTMGIAYGNVWSVIEKAIQKEVNNRFQDCAEFQNALSSNERVSSSKNTTEQKVNTATVNTEKPLEKSKGNLTKQFFGVFGAVLLLAVLYFVFFNKEESNYLSDSDEDQEQQVDQNGAQGSNDADSPAFDAALVLTEFLAAEDNRDFDQIYSFFAQDMQRYWSFTNPSYGKLNKEYNASWNRSAYSKNNVLEIRRIDDLNYQVSIDFEFLQYNREDVSHVNSELRFVFDENGKITEMYGIN